MTTAALACLAGCGGPAGTKDPAPRPTHGSGAPVSSSPTPSRAEQHERLAAAVLPENAPNEAGVPSKLSPSNTFVGSPLANCDPTKDMKSNSRLTATFQRSWEGDLGGVHSAVFGYEKLTAAEVLAEIRTKVTGQCRNVGGQGIVYDFLSEHQVAASSGITQSFGYCTRWTLADDDTPLVDCTIYFGRETNWGVVACVGVVNLTEADAWRLVSSLAPKAAAQLAKV
ncbi:hypothetical protein [Longispora urticae]